MATLAKVDVSASVADGRVAGELFELEILGGPLERSYRKARPEVERMPWGTMDISSFDEQHVVAARQAWTGASFQEHRTAAACASTLRALIEVRAPIDLIVPKEGLGWEMEATAIMKGTKNLEAAKKLADWASSLKANELYGKYYAIVANPQVKSMPPNYPADGEKLMAKMDVEWMAKNRDRILAEWTKRYDGKSAPKAK